jgi:hypothetical protein
MVAVFILQLLPYVLLYLGRILLATDILKGAADDLPEMGAATAQAVLTAGLLGGISMAISAFTPRRAYAVAGIIAAFIIPGIVTGLIVALGALDIGPWLVLLSPTSVLEGTNAVLFDTARGGPFDGVVDVPDVAYFVAAAVGIAGAGLLTIRRFQRITA